MVQTAQVGIAILDSKLRCANVQSQISRHSRPNEEQALGKRLDDPDLNAFLEDGTTCLSKNVECQGCYNSEGGTERRTPPHPSFISRRQMAANQRVASAEARRQH